MKSKISASLVLLGVFAAFAFTGCKERTILGQNMNLTNNNLNLSDTYLTCTTSTYYDADTEHYTNGVNTLLYVFHALGVVNSDPIFGKTYGDSYFQLVPPTQVLGVQGSFNFSNLGLTPDSAELILPYSGSFWGDSLGILAPGDNMQTYQVYQITDTTMKVFPTAYYFASTQFQYDKINPLSVATTINMQHIADSVMINGVNTAPHMRIKLDPSIIQTLNSLGDNAYSSTFNFTSAFRGIYVRAVEHTHSLNLPYIRLDGNPSADFYSMYTRAGILVHCHTNTVSDTLFSYYFDPTYCAFNNNVRRDYSSRNFANIFNKPSDKIYLQNAPGAGMDIVVHGINQIPKSVVNRAELEITMLPGGNGVIWDSILSAPPRLYAEGVKVQGGVASTYTLADREPISSTSPLEIIDGYAHVFNYPASGNLPATSMMTYTINIPREVQSAMINGVDTIHLHINGTFDLVGAYRLVAAGGNYSDQRLRTKMRVVYSKIK